MMDGEVCKWRSWFIVKEHCEGGSEERSETFLVGKEVVGKRQDV